MLKIVYISFLLIGTAVNASIDSILEDANSYAETHRGLVQFSVPRTDDGQIMNKKELDLMLTPEQERLIYGDESGRKRRNFQKIAEQWPGGVLIYQFGPMFSTSSSVHNAIQAAMDDIMKVSCITFRKRTRKDKNFVTFIESDGCWSLLGMSGGQQFLSLGRGCKGVGTIQHELLHALGFLHEQSRPDRDNYITILEGNVDPSNLSQFRKSKVRSWNSFSSKYDYDSIMHYSQYAFSKSRRQVTIRTKDTKYQKLIGSRKTLSFDDILQLNKAYSCEDSCKSKPSCKSGSFLMANCKCYCKGSPLNDCTPSTSKVTSAPAPKPTRTPDTSGSSYTNSASYQGATKFQLTAHTSTSRYANTKNLEGVYLKFEYANGTVLKSNNVFKLTVSKGYKLTFSFSKFYLGAPLYVRIGTKATAPANGWIISKLTDNVGNSYGCSTLGHRYKNECTVDSETGSKSYTIFKRTSCKTPSKTVSGRTCQSWSSNSPHKKNRVSESQTALWKKTNTNTCQDPDTQSNFLWCYTTEAKVRWEKCTQSAYHCRQN